MAENKKPLVLVVEDDSNTNILLKFFLRDNYETCFAISVAEAKEKMDNQPVEIILLDLSLDGNEDGLDLVKYLRKMKKWKDIPIIATTAHAFTKDRDNCFQAGCNDYLAKPYSRTALMDKIMLFLK